MEQKKFLIPIFVLVVFLAVVKLLLANMLSTTSLKIAQAEKQVLAIERENNLLGEEIAKLSSLSRISPEAVKLGFGKPSLVVSLTPEVPVALK